MYLMQWELVELQNGAEKCVASSVQNTSRIYLDKLNFIYSNQDLVKLQLYLVHKVCTITLTVHFFCDNITSVIQNTFHSISVF